MSSQAVENCRREGVIVKLVQIVSGLVIVKLHQPERHVLNDAQVEAASQGCRKIRIGCRDGGGWGGEAGDGTRILSVSIDAEQRMHEWRQPRLVPVSKNWPGHEVISAGLGKAR